MQFDDLLGNAGLAQRLQNDVIIAGLNNFLVDILMKSGQLKFSFLDIEFISQVVSKAIATAS